MKIYAIITFLCIYLASAQNPDFIISIFRHGIRAPASTLYDTVNWSPWQIGELTPSGLRMQFILGEAMALNYSNIFKDYSPSQLFVRSTNFNRTIMSAYSQLYGIFQNQGQEYNVSIPSNLTLPPYDSEFVAELNETIDSEFYLPLAVQPIPVHSQEVSDDTLLYISSASCPNSATWQATRNNDSLSQEFSQLLANNTQFYIENNCPINSLMNLSALGDTVIANTFNNVSLPCSIQYNDSNYHAAIFAYEFVTAHVLVGNNQSLVIFSMHMLNQLYDWINGYSNGSYTRNSVLLSGQDTTLMSILAPFNITNEACLMQNYKDFLNGEKPSIPTCIYPSFGSHIIFELYNTSEPYVVFYYNGMPFNICGNDDNTCTLPEFKEYIQNLTMGLTEDDFAQICGVPEIDKEITIEYEIPCIILGVLLLIQFGVATMMMMQRKKNYMMKDSLSPTSINLTRSV